MISSFIRRWGIAETIAGYNRRLTRDIRYVSTHRVAKLFPEGKVINATGSAAMKSREKRRTYPAENFPHDGLDIWESVSVRERGEALAPHYLVYLSLRLFLDSGVHHNSTAEPVYRRDRCVRSSGVRYSHLWGVKTNSVRIEWPK